MTIRREPPPRVAVVRHVSGEVAPYGCVEEYIDHEMRPPWNQLPSLSVLRHWLDLVFFVCRGQPRERNENNIGGEP